MAKKTPKTGVGSKRAARVKTVKPVVETPTSRLAENLSTVVPPAPVIRVPDRVAGYSPTDEQASILEIAPSAGKCLVICAGAGTGKTSTLKMLEETLTGRGQYTAFNSSLVAESKTKFRKASCNTTHSLAFRAVGRLYAHRLNGTRMRSEQMATRLGIEARQVVVGVKEDGSPHVKTLSAAFLAGQVLVAIRRFCQSDDREISDKHFKYIDGIDSSDETGRGYVNNGKVREYLVPFAAKAWKDLADPNGTLPFHHDVYVKVWQLGTGKNRPVIDADYILLDESQDTAPVFLDVLKQQSHALVIFVGDENQQIYEWRGAVNAMAAFPDAPRRLLSQSFRFGQSVADVANSILRELEHPTDLVMKGLPSIPSRVITKLGEGPAAPDCVLCRSNACAVSTVLIAQREGRRAHLIGGSSEVVEFVRAARDLQANRPTGHPELCCFENWQEVEAYAKTDEGSDLKLMVRLINEFGCDAILSALENMPAEKDADLVVSTAHKSKGREWDTVKLAGDFPPLCRMSDSDCRLLYVAATRAKVVLDVSECTPFRPYTDRTTGETTPGIEIRYTAPMPTEAETAAYLATKDVEEEEKAKVVQVVDSTVPPTPANTVASDSDDGYFTWAKQDGVWTVRGASGKVGKFVTVTRKDGSTSRVRLTGIYKEMGNVTCYRT